MIPQTQPRKTRNSSRVNLLISLGFHTIIIVALFYFAAREGLLGKQLRKIAVEMVKEKPPEKPPEPPKPREETPLPETAVAAPTQPVQPARTPPRESTPPPARVAAPPAAAPPAASVPSFVFEGGRAVQTTSDPVNLYKGFIEYALRSRWNRPTDVEDRNFVAELEISVDPAGTISSPEWKRRSGHSLWDSSVTQAIAATRSVNRPPPTNFPSRILVRFDVQETDEIVTPLQ